MEPSNSSNLGASTNPPASTNPAPTYRLQMANQSYIIIPPNTTLSSALSGVSMTGPGITMAQNSPQLATNSANNFGNNLMSTGGQKGKIMILTTSGGQTIGHDVQQQQQPNPNSIPSQTHRTYSPLFATKTPISATTSKFFTNTTKSHPQNTSITSTITPSVVTLVNSPNQQILTTGGHQASSTAAASTSTEFIDPTQLRPSTSSASSSSYSYKPSSSAAHRVYQTSQQSHKYDIVKELLDKKHREMDSDVQGMDSMDLELADAEVKKVMGGGAAAAAVSTKSVAEMTEAEMAKLLYSDEKLDRESPELWPEQVPGVINFMHSTFPNFDEDDDQDGDRNENVDEPDIIPLAAAGPDNHVIKMETDSGVSSGCSELTTVKKFTRSFDFTDYGLTLSVPAVTAAAARSPEASEMAEGDSPTDDQANGVPESNDNSSRNSPIDGLVGGSNDTKSGPAKPSSTASSSLAAAAAAVPKPQPTPTKPTFKPHLIPEWQKGLDDEEISMLYGFGSLTTSALLDKVKEITNLAYQLGLEEEREIARARFLDILGEGKPGGAFFANGHLTKNDFQLAESQLQASRQPPTSNGNSSSKSSTTSSTTKRKKTST